MGACLRFCECMCACVCVSVFVSVCTETKTFRQSGLRSCVGPSMRCYQSTGNFLSQLLMWRKCALSGHYSLYVVELPPTSSSPLSSSLLFVSLLDQNLARLESRVLTLFWSPESSNQSPGFLLLWFFFSPLCVSR